MNNKTLIALALAKTIYNEKRNYLDAFAPFLIRSLDQSKYRTIQEIENFLKVTYSLVIPLNTIQSILKRLEKGGYIRLEGRGTDSLAAIPKSKATEHLDHTEEEADKIARKQNKLVSRLKNHFSEELKKDFSEEDIETKLKKYILDNISNLAILNGRQNHDKYDYSSQNATEKSITRFLITIFDQEQELYESFNDLLKGAVLWQSIAEKDSVNDESAISQLTVYLDTNIVLSLLGLHHESINRAARQLNELLQNDNKIHVRVFDKTLEEVINLLAGYKYNKDNYGSQRVNHVYFFLKKKGFDDADIDIFIEKIEHKLEDLQIYKEELEIDDTSDLKKRELKLYEQLYSENKTYETEKTDEFQRSEEAVNRSTLHDVAIISKIRNIRNGWQSSFEKCKAIFLTNSYRLYKFSSRNKLNKQAITEVITDITLTNILWLKNPGSDVGITIDNLLYVHSSEFMVDNKIWRKFLRTLKQMHNSGEIDEGDYALLMSKNQLKEEYLLSKKQEEITPESVRELTNDIKKQSVKKDNELEIKNKKIEELQDIEQKKDNELNTYHNENENLEQNLSILQKEHNNLKEQFENSQINRLYVKKLRKKVASIKTKTKKGIGLAFLAIAFIYFLVVFIKVMPLFFPEGVLGFDVSTPNFEYVFSTVLSVILAFGTLSYVSIKDSNWSFIEAYWAFWDEEKIEDKYKEELKSSAVSDVEQT